MSGPIEDKGFDDVEGAMAVAKRLREYRRRVSEAAAAEQLLAAEEVDAMSDPGDSIAQFGKMLLTTATRRAELQAEHERRRASVVRRQAELLVELLDQRIELHRVRQRPFGAGLLGQIGRNFFNFIKCVWPSAAEHSQHRDVQIAQEADLPLQLAEAIFLHSFIDLSVHGFGFHKIPFEEMAGLTPASEATHRLSGDAK